MYIHSFIYALTDDRIILLGRGRFSAAVEPQSLVTFRNTKALLRGIPLHSSSSHSLRTRPGGIPPHIFLEGLVREGVPQHPSSRISPHRFAFPCPPLFSLPPCQAGSTTFGTQPLPQEKRSWDTLFTSRERTVGTACASKEECCTRVSVVHPASSPSPKY